MDLPDFLTEKLSKVLEKDTLEIPEGIYEYATKYFSNELRYLCYPDLYILPLTPKGEEIRLWLHNEGEVGRYGVYEENFKYRGKMFLAILVNND